MEIQRLDSMPDDIETNIRSHFHNQLMRDSYVTLRKREKCTMWKRRSTDAYIREEMGHGRIEKRVYDLYHNGMDLFKRYYVSSLGLEIKKIADAIRTHWSIENNLHWHLITYPLKEVNSGDNLDKIRLVLKKYGIEDKCVRLWGTGKPLREFLWSEEMADASVYIMGKVDFRDLITNQSDVRNCHINIGTGKEISIQELAFLIQRTIGYEGKIVFDSSKPDGTLRKLTDVTRLHRLGWHHRIEIEEGVQKLFDWYSDKVRERQKDAE